MFVAAAVVVDTLMNVYVVRHALKRLSVQITKDRKERMNSEMGQDDFSHVKPTSGISSFRSTEERP